MILAHKQTLMVIKARGSQDFSGESGDDMDLSSSDKEGEPA